MAGRSPWEAAQPPAAETAIEAEAAKTGELEPEAIGIYHGGALAQAWLARHRGQPWQLSCVLGFTETALVPGISAAGKTPGDRRFTALADAEFLYRGLEGRPSYALPPLTAGLSPVLISRSLVEAAGIAPPPASSPIPPLSSQAIPPPSSLIPLLVNAGLALPLTVPALDLGGQAARCLSSGAALGRALVQHLFDQGLRLGETQVLPREGYAVLGECVVGGTTTALAILLGLGVAAQGRVNSSHSHCNHSQKAALVSAGLRRAGLLHRLPSEPNINSRINSSGDPGGHSSLASLPQGDPLDLVAAVGDPMQPLVAGWAIALSRRHGLLLAGGTQMLAVYALAAALVNYYGLPWCPERIAVGTTDWVIQDPSGDTPGLAVAIAQWHQQQSESFGSSSALSATAGVGPILLGSRMRFGRSRHPALGAYEAGFVKEGVGAGGCAIATSLSQGYSVPQLCQTIDRFVDRYYAWRQDVTAGTGDND